jgi:excinuclease UvrABC nuclease subunit
MFDFHEFSKPFLLPYYPHSSGVYVLIDEKNVVLYVGRTVRLCQRVSHLTAFQKDSSNDEGYSHIKAGTLRRYQEKGHQVSVLLLECKNCRAKEKDLIKELKPLWNKKRKRRNG